MPDQLFQKLFDDTAGTSWQSAGDLRARAHRRRRTRVALVAAAAAVTIAGATGTVAAARLDSAPPDPGVSPTVAPAPQSPTVASPSPTTAPPATVPGGDRAPVNELLLRPEDVGPGYRTASGGGDWTFEFSASMLGCRSAPRPVMAVEGADRSLLRGAPEADDRLSEAVSRYGPGDASRYLAEVRARVAACEPVGTQTISIADRDFAGEEALLVTVDYGGQVTHHVLVRQGDLLAELFVKPAWDRAALRGLARVAAAILCDGTPAC